MAGQFVVRDRILIAAPIERCFLLSTSVALVERELGMHPVRGRTTGLVEGGDTVRWQGWQLGLPQFHESLIEPFEPPHYFRDRMIAGRFQSFQHDHRFEPQPDGRILLADEIRFTMRWGWAGALAGRWILLPHIRGLLRRRFAMLKQIAESEEWRRYIPAEAEREG
jgi:ligand-binding SRPBCC domain-containing protein